MYWNFWIDTSKLKDVNQQRGEDKEKEAFFSQRSFKQWNELHPLVLFKQITSESGSQPGIHGPKRSMEKIHCTYKGVKKKNYILISLAFNWCFYQLWMQPTNKSSFRSTCDFITNRNYTLYIFSLHISCWESQNNIQYSGIFKLY